MQRHEHCPHAPVFRMHQVDPVPGKDGLGKDVHELGFLHGLCGDEIEHPDYAQPLHRCIDQIGSEIGVKGRLKINLGLLAGIVDGPRRPTVGAVVEEVVIFEVAGFCDRPSLLQVRRSGKEADRGFPKFDVA